MVFFKNYKFSEELKWPILILAVFLFLLVIIIGFFVGYHFYYKNKFYPRTFINKIPVGGLTKEQAKFLLNKKIDYINQEGVVFDYNGNKTTLTPILTAPGSDVAYPLIVFDVDEPVENIFNKEKGGSFSAKPRSVVNSLFKDREYNLPINLNENEIKKFLMNHFSQLELPAKNASLVFKLDEQNNPIFYTEEERPGNAIHYDEAVSRLKTVLLELDNSSISLKNNKVNPQILKNELTNITDEALALYNNSSTTLKYEKKTWMIPRLDSLNWFLLEKNASGTILVILDQQKIAQYLEEKIAPEINQAPQDAKFEIKDNAVQLFQASRNGIKLNTTKTAEAIKNNFLNNKDTELIVDAIPSNINTSNTNNLGIKEIVGMGESKFSGSPTNRRHNIKTGANKLNGLLIAPGEEFSLNKALGDIDKESGYLPELVIKKGQTVPEYGGGLCQVATTMFRAALESGLPITQRYPHAYRVQYYEPAGTDATIYNPWPDLKFINDTGNYILIQSRIDGDNLYFDMWGTKDGRIIEKTEPVIYNVVSPAAAKIIETTDLPVGQKKCIETAHKGADAYFNYKVTYPNGEVKEKKFTSHYTPWQAVCRVGVEKLTNSENNLEENKNNSASTTTQPIKNN